MSDYSESPEQIVDEIAANPRVCVSVQSSGGSVSVAVQSTVDDRREAVEERWNPAVDAWFAEGPALPSVGGR